MVIGFDTNTNYCPPLFEENGGILIWVCPSVRPSVRPSVCPSVRLLRFGFHALTALKIVRFHPNSVCKYTRTIVRLSSKANAIRAYLRILIRLLNSHWLIGFRALTALKIV